MKKLTYKDWQPHPEIVDIKMIKSSDSAIWKHRNTKHEGKILYLKLWNFWVRAGVEADLRADRFFRDYERANAQTDALLQDIGFPWSKAETEEEVWTRIGMVWNWLKDNVHYGGSAYSSISSVSGEWPSILDYAKYYAVHGNLVWAACFSKAHLFATLLGRIVYPRYRIAVASCHHTENGAPPTASHVYVAVYVGERWFYLDPTAVNSVEFPSFAQRQSIGVSGFTSVDYQHPFKLLPVPLSGFTMVPYLPK